MSLTAGTREHSVFEDAAGHLLDQVVDATAAEYRDVPVERVLVRASPADALLGAARDAALVVVGGRGVGGFRGLLLGSVSQHLAHHAPCPVVVVRGATRPAAGR
jgi:nucleotide-binding universal stress UspA family protein